MPDILSVPDYVPVGIVVIPQGPGGEPDGSANPLLRSALDPYFVDADRNAVVVIFLDKRIPGSGADKATFRINYFYAGTSTSAASDFDDPADVAYAERLESALLFSIRPTARARNRNYRLLLELGQFDRNGRWIPANPPRTIEVLVNVV